MSEIKFMFLVTNLWTKIKKEENNTHHWPKGTCLITGDSLVEEIDE